MKNMNRWLRAAAGVVLMLFLGAMYAWSYFKVALGESYPAWSQTQITLNFTILMSCFCLGSLLAGSVMIRIPKRGQLLIAAVLTAAGFWGASMLPAAPEAALLQLYLCYGALTGLGTGVAYNAVLSGVQPWFPDCPGLISGTLLMGMGFGALIQGNVAAILVEAVGLPATFRVFSIAMLAVLLVCSAAVRLPGTEDRLPAPKAGGNTAVSSRDFSTGEMLRRLSFWLFFLWNIGLSAGGMLVINAASSITVYYGLAAVVGLVVSVFNGLGRLVIGSCMDRLGWKNTMYLNNGVLLGSGLLLLLGDRTGSGLVALAGMLLMGVCYGGGITIAATLVRQLYGGRYYAANFSVANLCTIPASILGPMLSAALQDASGGGYFTTFLMVAVLGVVTLGINLMIRRP